MKIVIIQGEYILGEALPVEALASLARLQQAGSHLLVLPAMTPDAMDEALLRYERLQQHLARLGGRAEALVFCSHGPSERCRCHGPDYSLLEEALARFRVKRSQLHAVGDPVFAAAATLLGAVAHELEKSAGPDQLRAIIDSLLDNSEAT